MSAALLPCAFCRRTPIAFPRTCDKRTPYNPADRAFPQVRCRCGISVDGTDWTSVDSAIEKWNRHAKPADDLLKALTQLCLMARTTGGTAGPDPELIRACEGAEALIGKTMDGASCR